MLRRWSERIFRNPGYKLLSFSLAFFAWWYVQQAEVHESQVRARVEWQYPDGLTPSDQLPSHILLNVRGTGAMVRSARAADIRVPVDLADVGVGEHEVDFMAFQPAGLPAGLDVSGTSPSAVTFGLDELASRKLMVRPVIVGEPAPGFRVAELRIVPNVVEVKGPRSRVDALLEAKTQAVDVTGLNLTTDLKLSLDLPRGVTLADPSAVPQATVEVLAERERRVLSAVPVQVWVHHGWAVLPDSISLTLEGPLEALEDVEPQDVTGFVHLPDVPERSRYKAEWGPEEGVRLRILHGAGPSVSVVSVEPPEVEVLLR